MKQEPAVNRRHVLRRLALGFTCVWGVAGALACQDKAGPAAGAAGAQAAVQATGGTAEPYPSRPITEIVPFSAGGPTDVIARITGEHMSKTLGQQLIIE